MSIGDNRLVVLISGVSQDGPVLSPPQIRTQFHLAARETLSPLIPCDVSCDRVGLFGMCRGVACDSLSTLRYM